MPDFHVSWLTAFMFMQDFVFENGAWGGLRPLEWKEEEVPPWPNEMRPIFSLG